MTNTHIIVGTYDEVLEAHLSRIRLESAGIPCCLVDENTHVLGGPVASIRLQILERDRDRALQILSDKFDAELDEGELERQALAAGMEDDVA